jgi:two-component system, NarL family, sensor kinase
LSLGSETGFAREEIVVLPWLLECDSAGKLVWMSERTREALGGPEDLANLILATLRARNDGRVVHVYPLYFWRIWQTAESVILGVLPPRSSDPVLLELLRLESRLLQHLVRLLVQERRLSDTARRRRENRGLTAIRAIEQERQRVGRDLHTGIGQAMAAILLQVDVLAGEVPERSARMQQALGSISTLATGALDQVRSVARKLHPPEWQRLTIETALRQLWEISGIPERFEAHIHIDPLPQEPIPEIKALLYRTLQETLSNLVRHSKATRVEARLAFTGDLITLAVSDNGVGFDIARIRAEQASIGSGIGLRSIRELVEGVGGDFNVESGPAGTTLVISVERAPLAC